LKTKFPLSPLLLLAMMAGLLLNGCGVLPKAPEPTATAIPATATPEPTATHTQAPTATATSAPTDTPTPLPSPTEDLAATQSAQETAAANALNDMVAKDLEKYEVDPASGHVVWSDKQAVDLTVTDYMGDSNHWLEDAGSLTDFVVQSDVTWETSGALSLCGITFHAQNDLEKGKQNRFFLMRLQFDPGWTIWRWEYGQFKNFLSGGWRSSSAIHDENGDSNVLALVVKGKDIFVYINHDKQAWLEDLQLKDGLLALSAYQESGKTQCIFENTWVWAFDQ